MNTLRQTKQYPISRNLSRSAFSLIEVLVVVGLLSFIVFGLMLMFIQTQKAFKTGTTQTDVLESGRMVTEMLKRDFEEMRPYGAPFVFNFFVEAGRWTDPTDSQLKPMFSYQEYPNTSQQKTNVVENVYFLRRENNTWKATGYFVLYEGGVGTLQRYYVETNNYASANDLRTFQINFANDASAAQGNPNYNFGNRVQAITEGVVNFSVHAYNPNGVLITNSQPYMVVTPIVDTRLRGTDTYAYRFSGDAVPAYVEFELGVIEKGMYERMKSIPNANARANFLREHAGQVHLFRQRVTVRSVDPEAYK